MNEQILAAARDISLPLPNAQMRNANLMQAVAFCVIRSFFEAYNLVHPVDDMDKHRLIAQAIEKKWANFIHKCVAYDTRQTIWTVLTTGFALRQDPSFKVGAIEQGTACVLLHIDLVKCNTPRDGTGPLLFALENDFEIETLYTILIHGGRFLGGEENRAMTALAKRPGYVISDFADTMSDYQHASARIDGGGTALHHVCATETDMDELYSRVVSLLRFGVNPTLLDGDELKTPKQILEARFPATTPALAKIATALASSRYRERKLYGKSIARMMRNAKGMPYDIAERIVLHTRVAT